MPFGLSSSDLIALASLLVAIVSMIYTVKASHTASRRIDAIEDKPVLWLELGKLSEDCWLAQVKIRNRTHYSIRLDALSVEIERVPVDKFQSFLLGDYAGIADKLKANPKKVDELVKGRDNALKMTLAGIVEPEQTSVVHALLFRGKGSSATEAKLYVDYSVLKETPSFRRETVKASLGGAGITFDLQRI